MFAMLTGTGLLGFQTDTGMLILHGHTGPMGRVGMGYIDSNASALSAENDHITNFAGPLIYTSLLEMTGFGPASITPIYCIPEVKIGLNIKSPDYGFP